jgi:4-diphosphocytidyl-2-C-methyl-D-erythritol kinase
MISFPNAKINIGLNIVEKRNDGYHNLETIFYPIPLKDALESNIKKDISATTLLLSGIPIDSKNNDNLIIRAYNLLLEKYHLPPIELHLQKNIPMGAGLGGGSANASFALMLFNEQFKLGLSSDLLKEYATSLGADCPFFIENKPVFATGIGEKMTRINLSLKGYYLLLVKPDIFISTQTAFAGITPQKPKMHLNELISSPIIEWKDNIHNDFEDSIFLVYPILRQIKEKMYDQGAIYASMSGSGSTIYGIFKKDCSLLESSYSNSFCQTLYL